MNIFNLIQKTSFCFLMGTSIFSLTAGKVNAASLGQVVVANRNAGNISVINVNSDQVVKTVPLPFSLGELTPEPMYVVHLPSLREVAVGDRANNRVVFFDQLTYTVKDTVPAGNGIFHMWADPLDQQLWVINDVDQAITVINPQTKTELITIDVSDAFPSNEDIPHDVIIDPTGDSAYVSFINPDGADQVAKYSTSTFSKLIDAAVGENPHLSVTPANEFLYVPALNGDEVAILNRSDLSLVTSLNVPGAHGTGMAPNGNYFYTTNLPSEPNEDDVELITIDVAINQVVSTVDTPFVAPHNIAVTGDSSKLYISHSASSANQVTVYSLEDPSQPLFEKTIFVDTRPYGITFVAAVPEPLTILGTGFVLVYLPLLKKSLPTPKISPKSIRKLPRKFSS